MNKILVPAFLNQLTNPQVAAEDEPKALRILKCIQDKGRAELQEIKTITGVDYVNQYIKLHINHGFVIVDRKEPKKTFYSLLDGLSAEDIYSGHARRQQKMQEDAIAAKLPNNSENIAPKNDANPVPSPGDFILDLDMNPVKKGMQERVKKEADSMVDGEINTEKLDEILNANESTEQDLDVDQVVEKVKAFAKAFNASAPLPATSGNFRCAYTNDGCLMLFGLNDYSLPVELNASQTNDLIEFISEQITPIGVSI